MIEKNVWYENEGAPCPFEDSQLVGVRMSEGFYQISRAGAYTNLWTNRTITHYMKLDFPPGITR